VAVATKHVIVMNATTEALISIFLPNGDKILQCIVIAIIMCLTTTTTTTNSNSNNGNKSFFAKRTLHSPDVENRLHKAGVMKSIPVILRIGFDATLVPLSLCFPSILTSRTRAGMAMIAYVGLMFHVRQQYLQQTKEVRTSEEEEEDDQHHHHNHVRWCWGLLLLAFGIGSLLMVIVSAYITFIVTKHAKPANRTAIESRDRGIGQGTIVCNDDDGYDVYLPPTTLHEASSSSSSSSSCATLKKKKIYAAGMIFLPGALVSHDAYAGILSLLANHGILVVLIKLDPLRMPVPFYNGTSSRSISQLITQVESIHEIRVNKWAVAGHSVGGSTVAGMMRDPCPSLSGIHHVILWGVNTTQDLERDTSSQIHALCITASEDGFRGKSMGRGSPDFDKAWENVSRLQHVEIRGGNHGGFADYPPQIFPRRDGAREITLAQQHERIVQATVNFLLSKQE